MAKKKKALTKEDIFDRCTCKEKVYALHLCTYKEDVNDDNESECRCCPYCTQECCDDIQVSQ